MCECEPLTLLLSGVVRLELQGSRGIRLCPVIIKLISIPALLLLLLIWIGRRGLCREEGRRGERRGEGERGGERRGEGERGGERRGEEGRGGVKGREEGRRGERRKSQ